MELPVFLLLLPSFSLNSVGVKFTLHDIGVYSGKLSAVNVRNEITSVSYAKIQLPAAKSDAFLRIYDACLASAPYVLVADSSQEPTPDRDLSHASLPCFLRIRNSSLPNAGLGVFAEAGLEAGVVFGPFRGVLGATDDIDESSYAWDLNDGSGEDMSIDSLDPSRSNWMRYVNSARWGEEQNAVALIKGSHVYYALFKPVLPGQEILIWYGPNYDLPYKVNRNLYDEGIAPPKSKVRCPTCEDWDGAQEKTRTHPELK